MEIESSGMKEFYLNMKVHIIFTIDLTVN